jgi:hypothetical protein
MPPGGRLLSSARALFERSLAGQIPKYALASAAGARVKTRTPYGGMLRLMPELL